MPRRALVALADTKDMVAPGSPGAHLGGHAGAVRAVRAVAGVLHGYGLPALPHSTGKPTRRLSGRAGLVGTIGPLIAPRATTGSARAAHGFARRCGADGPLARVELPESATS